MNDSIRMLRHISFMRDEYDRFSFGIEFLKNGEDILSCFAVKISGGFIR